MGDCRNYCPFLGPSYNIRHLLLRDPKGDHHFDNRPYTIQLHGALGKGRLGKAATDPPAAQASEALATPPTGSEKRHPPWPLGRPAACTVGAEVTIPISDMILRYLGYIIPCVYSEFEVILETPTVLLGSSLRLWTKEVSAYNISSHRQVLLFWTRVEL